MAFLRWPFERFVSLPVLTGPLCPPRSQSAERIALPTFDGDALSDLIQKLVMMDSHWIPSEAGHSLYIRPTMIGTQNALGVGPAADALLFVICCPVGPYYPSLS